MLQNGIASFRRARIRKVALPALLAIGASIAVPVIGAGTASAASGGSVWDAVAQCESSGNWSIDTGNGFFGGLQFTSSTWAAYGGLAYAPEANQATEAEQITVAQAVLAGQGPGAWPVCSVQAGLTASNGGASSASVPSSSSGSSSAGDTASTATQSSTTQSSSSADSGSSSSGASLASSTASTGGYTVVAGDTLDKIAAANNVQGGWQALYSANQSVIGGDPNLIFPGQSLSL